MFCIGFLKTACGLRGSLFFMLNLSRLTHKTKLALLSFPGLFLPLLGFVLIEIFNLLHDRATVERLLFLIINIYYI